MTNMFCLVGRIIEIIKNAEDDLTVQVAVNRSYKNEEGIYETDIIPVRVIGGIATNTLEYCSKGDLIGIKGRIENRNGVQIIAEKVTFLSNKKKENE